jgi:hypothetical protein
MQKVSVFRSPVVANTTESTYKMSYLRNPPFWRYCKGHRIIGLCIYAKGVFTAGGYIEMHGEQGKCFRLRSGKFLESLKIFLGMLRTGEARLRLWKRIGRQSVVPTVRVMSRRPPAGDAARAGEKKAVTANLLEKTADVTIISSHHGGVAQLVRARDS